METDVFHGNGRCLARFLILMFCGCSCYFADDSVLPDEQRLLQKIFHNYDTSVRPVYNSSHTVVVTFNYNLIQVMDMDEKNQVLTINAWLESTWIDERITWNPKDFNGLNVFRVPANKLWLPDIVLYNNADEYVSGFMKCNVMLFPDGMISWSPPARLRSSCHIDITYFPFDSQECTQKFGSWSYDQAQVDFQNRSNVLEVGNYVTNGEWTLFNTKMERNEKIYPIGDAVFPDVTITIVIYRRILYYVLNLLLPCFWLNVLNVLTFCLPPDACEKLTLSITVFLSYSVFMLLVADTMPPTSESVPLIEIYLTLSMAMSSVSIIMTVMVLKLYHSPPDATEVPPWVRTLILGCLSRVIQCKCIKVQRKKTNSPHIIVGDIEEKSSLFPDQPASTASKDTDRLCDDLHISNRRSGQNHESTSENIAHIYELSNSGLEGLMKYMKLIVLKGDKTEEEEDLKDEWKQVALIVDRSMFYLFLFLTMFATLVILVIVPVVSYTKSGSK